MRTENVSDASNVIAALDSLAETHDIDPVIFGEALAESLRSAVMRTFDSPDAYVALDLDTGEVVLMALPADSDPVPVTLADLGRRGAAAIKEAFDRTISSVREARLTDLLASKSGQLVSGRITQASAEAAIITLADGVEAELLASQAAGLRLRPGSLVSAILTGEVDASGGTPRAWLTRRTPEFIAALLAEAVPSVADGAIEILEIAREPGIRSKVLVRSASPSGPDPVGLIIGSKGSTIRKVADEIFPERIDIVAEGPIEEMVVAALTPGRISRVEVSEDGSVVAWLASSERSAALGRDGSNVRLASQLLGRRIEVKAFDADTEPADAA